MNNFGNCNCALRLLVVRDGYSQRTTEAASSALADVGEARLRISGRNKFESSQLVVHNRVSMRRVAIFPAILALLLAFLMAPYQHVHLATDDREGADHDHDDAAVVHVHFYAVTVPINRNGEASLEDSHGGHVSRSLDTFTTMPQAGLSAFVQPESRIFLFPPAVLVVRFVEVTEPCGHDPPFLKSSVPRAPPV